MGAIRTLHAGYEDLIRNSHGRAAKRIARAEINVLPFDVSADGFSPTRYTIPRQRTLVHQYSAKRDPTRCPSHPGVLLRKVVIPATGRSKAEIAALLGISRQHLHDILAEKKPVSAHVAVRLGKLFGDGAGVWLRMQAAYDTWHAERELAAEVKKIPTLTAA